MSKEESVPEDAKHNRRTTMLASFSPARLEAKGFPAPSEGFIVTHLLIVAGQERSRDFYSSVLGGKVIREDDPAVVRLAIPESSLTPVAHRPTTNRT